MSKGIAEKGETGVLHKGPEKNTGPFEGAEGDCRKPRKKEGGKEKENDERKKYERMDPERLSREFCNIAEIFHLLGERNFWEQNFNATEKRFRELNLIFEVVKERQVIEKVGRDDVSE